MSSVPVSKKDLEQFVATIKKPLSRYRPRGAKFSLWIDRQIRPTIGASVYDMKTRKDLGNIFMEALQVLTDVCAKLLPRQQLDDVVLTYNVGAWQRSRSFSFKAVMTTPAFLILTDKLCSEESVDDNLFHTEIDELRRREKNHYCGAKIREMLRDGKFVELHQVGNFRVGIAGNFYYPFLCIINRNSSTTISTRQLPEALNTLESFLFNSWHQDGYYVAMAPVVTSEASATPSYSYQVAAVVDEEAYARCTGKDVALVKAAQDRGTVERKYSRSSSSYYT